ncbi:hypothetical protein QOT17_019230 [Balamuthia mandrillaris]
MQLVEHLPGTYVEGRVTTSNDVDAQSLQMLAARAVASQLSPKVAATLPSGRLRELVQRHSSYHTQKRYFAETKRFYKNGTLREEKHFDAATGLLHGPWRRWYVDGTLKLSAAYHQGRLHGVWKEWDQQGECGWEGFFINGRPQKQCAKPSFVGCGKQQHTCYHFGVPKEERTKERSEGRAAKLPHTGVGSSCNITSTTVCP